MEPPEGGAPIASDAPVTSAPPDGDAAVSPAESVLDVRDTPDAGASPESCPPEMVRVDRRFCIDRFETSLVDGATEQTLSPYYPPSRALAASIEAQWEKQRRRMGNSEAQEMPLPILPAWQKTREVAPRAVSKGGVVPHGYLSGETASAVCRASGKRLCTLDEWRTACRGEKDETFPYGSSYVDGRCNVHRDGHAAAILHGDASMGHTDPRLNLTRVRGKPLLRRTGDAKGCASTWEEDAVFDMVGNLDEWIDDPEGTFVGGFYARATKEGCNSIIASHDYDYCDYSTGTRCCTTPPTLFRR
jgi:hypothetical protein